MQKMEWIWKANQYRALSEDKYYVDKTHALEKGILGFPSIFVVGAAASGKTTAVRMLLAKHPEVENVVFWMEEEERRPADFAERLRKLQCRVAERQTKIWVVFEELSRMLSPELTAEIADFIKHLPKNGRAILVGRDCPGQEFLELLWKSELELLPQETLLFTREEIKELAENMGSTLDVDELYEQTGGWAGCVAVMLRLSGKEEECGKKAGDRKSVEELRRQYEVDAYIRKAILDTLSEEESELMRRARVCPWLNESLCREVWGISRAEEGLELLGRKGLLILDRRKGVWKAAPLFQMKSEEQSPLFWKYLGAWYEEHGHIKEALHCIRQSDNKREYRAALVRHFDKVPFLGIPYEEIVSWKEDTPELCYLRGMYSYFHQDMSGLHREISKLEKRDISSGRIREIYLNLTYVKPDLPLDEWLGLLENHGPEAKSIRLYEMLGGSCAPLCGLRDLSGMFACTKKERNRKEGIWKKHLGEEEWRYLCLARINYFLETGQKDSVREEELALAGQWTEKDDWRLRRAKAYLMGVLDTGKTEREEMPENLENALLQEKNAGCVRNTLAVRTLRYCRQKDSKTVGQWLRSSGAELRADVREENYILLFAGARAYLFMSQFEKAERILERLIPWLKLYRRTRFLAEALFWQAVIKWEEGNHGLALYSVIESFSISVQTRYVTFYTEHGNRGLEVLREYVDWVHKNMPEGWHRKKKYNYGSILRMPVEDYLETVIRYAAKETRSTRGASGSIAKERLTMMETIILQDIGMGYTNGEICQELNLKLPTVKSHIYSLYKKLGVSSRTQAVLRGKELGVLK